MIVLGLPPFNLSFSVASALAFGAFAGFVVAAINWFRMKRRWKGAFHLLISPVIHLTFLFGIPLLVGLTIRLLSDGSTERAIEISQGISSEFVFALYFAAAFLVIAYLYSMTKRDITRLQAKDIATKYA
ncbi:MAG TPA: hypothetical protein VMP08_09805, partial [Anaerolineae bacterium]|nr:hypothetical protein [Anaerolineae bacterium]